MSDNNVKGPKGPNNTPPKGGAPQPKKNKNFVFIVVTGILVLLLLQLYSANANGETIDRTSFYKMMSDPGTLIKDLKLQRTPDAIVVQGTQLFTGKEEKSEAILNTTRKDETEKLFTTFLLEVSEETITEWEKSKNIKVKVIHDASGWIDHLFSILPIFLLIGFFWFMMSRQNGQGGGRGIFNFGKSKAKLMDNSKSKVTFKDVAGADEAKEELTEVVDFLKNPKKYDQMGAKIPKGALLLGPPGTGKTLLARAVAGEAKVPFYSMSGSDFVEMFVGVGASRVRDLFEQGKKNAPCILFIDEIDAVGRQRGAGVGGGHDEREQTLNQLLVEMDGFESNEGVILIAATNRADVLDKALLRPGRFDRHIHVDTPDMKGREAILNVHLNKRKMPLAEDVDPAVIAKGTPGMSGADIENLVNEAALLAARYNAKKVSMIDFEEAKDKLMIGAERRSLTMTEEELKITAYHEAGHGLMIYLAKHYHTLHKLTIIPRGGALGIAFSLPETDSTTTTKDFLQDRIAVALAGRAAELLMFNNQSTGAYSDIQNATEAARNMVTKFGMSEELGPILYDSESAEPFMGRGQTSSSQWSEETAIKIDREVRAIIDTQMKRVDEILKDNKEMLIKLAEALREHEVLNREEILAVLEGDGIETTTKSRQYQQMEDMKQKLKDGISVTSDEKAEPTSSEESEEKSETKSEDESKDEDDKKEKSDKEE